MSNFLPPGTTIGVLGGGQLGRMLAQAAQRMGYRVAMWVGGENHGPADVADEIFEDPFDSAEGVERFLNAAAVVTVEFENIPRPLLEAVAARKPLRPGAHAVIVSQHREREKTFLREQGFPHAPFAVVDSEDTLAAALLDLPESGGILKTAEFGYDGKGQLPVQRSDDPARIWSEFGSGRAVLEHKISLAAELSVLVARTEDGEVVSYDPVENIHRDHILDVSIVPARISPALQAKARDIAENMARALEYVGIMAVEFFVTGEEEILVNEIAPRPHNSGHHTLDACETSQFEQQLRCLCGLPAGSTRLHSPTVMLNLLGDVWIDNGGNPDWSAVLALPGTHLHLYGKRDPKPGRKMGHITTTAPTLEEAIAIQNQCRDLLRIPALKD